MSLAVAPITQIVADLLGTDSTGLLVTIVFISAVYLWATRTKRKGDE